MSADDELQESELRNFSVSIETDPDGYRGRECPICEKYFKVRPGTGLKDIPLCYCPYCSHHGDHDTFWTKEQIEYAQSVAVSQLFGELLDELRSIERRPDPNAFLSIGISVSGESTPIAYYSERDLEERVSCANCALDYTIYGAFGICPDCGIHNSKQIVHANFDLSLRLVELSLSADPVIAAKLVENALEDVISAFDGFGREYCGRLGHKVSFQNIDGAREKLLHIANVDIATMMEANDWQFVREQFQKRHIIAHRMGVIDEEFVRKTGSQLEIGRKVAIIGDDVRKLIDALRIAVDNLP